METLKGKDIRNHQAFMWGATKVHAIGNKHGAWVQVVPAIHMNTFSTRIENVKKVRVSALKRIAFI